MDGVTGFPGATQAPEAAGATFERMIHTLHHRGPDGYDFHVEPGVGLAHARLAVIDWYRVRGIGCFPLDDK